MRCGCDAGAGTGQRPLGRAGNAVRDVRDGRGPRAASHLMGEVWGIGDAGEGGRDGATCVGRRRLRQRFE